MLNDQKKAEEAQKYFENTFQKKNITGNIPTFKLSGKMQLNPVELLRETQLVNSNSEAKRLILGKAVEIDGKICEDSNKTIEIKEGMVIRVGKHRFVKIII
jgi:tyrosyl-tRNA synthetase